ncbi:MAG: 16S rRNA (cytosine(1402)-N(4))-methyltransferase RsmH [Candidatus Pacebacteria bacterium]|nr:16S rRNA (cytosine(1402)-N(4))-methyltransferase RsmH [Candidatus Paceibacterota bacterium]
MKDRTMYFHEPVLLDEVINVIDPKQGENLIDGTLGGGGHAEAILKKTSPGGKMLGIDLDDEALIESKRRLEKYVDRVILEKGNFVNFLEFTEKHNFHPINIFFLDLGISSQQLDSDSMGLSFLKNNLLDMRIGGGGSYDDERITAEQIINNWSADEIIKILKDYGEERYAKLIVRTIISTRAEKKIENTEQLVDIISSSVPERYKNQKIHYATKTFQALRIAVNQELESLQIVLPKAFELLQSGGRIGIISFHSLEDRIVKRFFQKEAKDCLCEVGTPTCVCNHKKSLEILTKKPITASSEELQKNPRSRSAKLRVAKKI